MDDLIARGRAARGSGEMGVTEDMIRVVLADDHAVVRVGLNAVLTMAPDIEVVGQAADGAQAVEAVRTLMPDVVVMDLTMPGIDGISATRTIVSMRPAPKVLVVTMHDEAEYLRPMLEIGAKGYLMKGVADRELITAIRAIARGDLYVSPDATRILMGELSRQSRLHEDRERLSKLTQRERDVLRLIAQGYTAPEIGERLFISPKTVDTYKARVQEKLGITHRSDYVQLALRVGMLTEVQESAGPQGVSR